MELKSLTKKNIMKLSEVLSPYNERFEKREKKKASIERLQRQVEKIDITYKTMVSEIADSIMKLIPGSFSYTVYGPFGLMSEMSISVNANNGGIYVNYNLHFFMRGDTILVTAYDETGNNPREVDVSPEDDLNTLVNLMSKSYSY